MKLITIHGMKCYRINDIKEHLSSKDYKKFEQFIRGQTCMIDENEDLLIYEYDYERFSNYNKLK